MNIPFTTNSLYIEGIGSYTPSTILTNEDLCQLVDTTNEWIVTRTGIKSRYILNDYENTSDAGYIAANIALENAKITADSISHLIVATCTPDFLCPNTACVISNKLGIVGPMAFDINAACSGFIYGLNIVQHITNDPTACVLLVCSDSLSKRVNWKDRSTCILFGDGAGALVLKGKKTPSTIAEVQDTVCYANGSYTSLLTVGGGTSKKYNLGDTIDNTFFITMEGQEVFKHAVRNLTEVCTTILQKNDLSFKDIDLFIPHQANQRIIEAAASRLSIPHEKTFINLDKYGNTSAASIPLAIADAIKQQRIQSGMRILLATFGGGFTWGAAILNFY